MDGNDHNQTWRMDPTEINEKGKHAASWLKRSYKRIISFLLLAFIIFTMILDLSLQIELTMQDIGMYAILMTVYIINLVLNADDGREAGRQNKRYIEQRKAYYEINNRMIGSGCSRFLPQFCRERREQNLIERRRVVLSRVNIGYGTYLTKYVGQEPPADLPKDKRKAIKLANSLKPEELTASMLLHEGKKEVDARIIGEDPNKRYLIELLTKILSAAFMTLIIGDVVGSSASGPSLASIAAGLAKLISYLVSGYFGYYTGYNNIALNVTDYMRQQTRVLHEFEAWYVEKGGNLESVIHEDTDAVPEGMDALTGELISAPKIEAAKDESDEREQGTVGTSEGDSGA